MDLYRHLLRAVPEVGSRGVRRRDAAGASGPARAQRIARTTAVRCHGRDLIRSAPRLRLEEGMATRPGRTRAVVTILVAAALVGLVAIGPFLGIPALICLISTCAAAGTMSTPRRVRGLLARRCPSSAASCSAVGSIADLLMGEDSRWWPLAVGPLIIGIVMVVVSLVLIAAPRGGRPVLPPSAARPATRAGRERRPRPRHSGGRSRRGRRGRAAGSIFMTSCCR